MVYYNFYNNGSWYNSMIGGFFKFLLNFNLFILFYRLQYLY